MITYQEENADNIGQDWIDLFIKHYEEIAWRKDKIKLNPDLDKYKIICDRGLMKVYTAREDGTLIGYAVWLVAPNLHYKDSIKAMNDILYVDPAKRGGKTGLSLIKFSEMKLKDLGVHSIGLHIKKSFDWGNVAERMGFECTESNYEKYIGD